VTGDYIRTHQVYLHRDLMMVVRVDVNYDTREIRVVDAYRISTDLWTSEEKEARRVPAELLPNDVVEYVKCQVRRWMKWEDQSA